MSRATEVEAAELRKMAKREEAQGRFEAEQLETGKLWKMRSATTRSLKDLTGSRKRRTYYTEKKISSEERET